MKLGSMDVQTFNDGKASFVVELSNKLNLSEIFNRTLTKHTGRPADISYGTLAQMMIVNMCTWSHQMMLLGNAS